jgi:hypothetical protein
MARKRLSKSPKQEWLLWLLGVALFSHCVGFFGISYFDQTRFAWFALIAIISAATIRKSVVNAPPKRMINESQATQEEEPMVPELVSIRIMPGQRIRAYRWAAAGD